MLDKFLEQLGYSIETKFNGSYTEYHVLYQQKDGFWATVEVLDSENGQSESDAYITAFRLVLAKLGIR
jgi:hypothetical protein